MTLPLFLGIDTGGTYTDAVLYSESEGILASAKALTTRHDLAVGVAGAVETVLSDLSGAAARISLVSLSTTLATNALVEGQGGRAALVMIGFSPEDLGRDGLADALGNDPVIQLPGGHDVHGRETPLDLTLLEERLASLPDEVSAVAIAGYFAVRNPAHEIAARDLIRARTALPVTCSHDLSSKLGGPRRALTTLLNARLISMVARLIDATSGYLEKRGIDAPLMVVRGDGALISAQEALLRPIETILSGPAASLVGARHLTGLSDAVVSDIGGTTTDVAVLENGRPRLDTEGATVGRYRTMVEAVAMHTFGLGGDSEVRTEEAGLEAGLILGPRRLMPLSLAGQLWPDTVVPALERQLRASFPGRLDGRFALRTGLPDALAAGLAAQESALYSRIEAEPQPLETVLTGTSQRATLDRLVARGLVMIAGFTPSDAMHVLGRQDQWNAEAARLGAELFTRRKAGSGKALAQSPAELANMVSERLTRQSAEAILTALFADQGVHGIDPNRSVLIDRALNRAPGFVRFGLGLDRPLVALGASAPVHYPAIAAMLDAESFVPVHAGVANAVGAVVGQVRETVIAFVTEPEEGRFAVNGAGDARIVKNLDEAFALARELARNQACDAAIRSGAENPVIESFEHIDMPLIEGLEKLVEARFTAIASGRPRIAGK
ncbi:N-methylhydantoinase A/acetone carboxylase, beta subunit [Hoeflea phototrophica DFL-43]|uniref:N-methylhydantoinase A/acetone carboxylase, beta subunit n=1 Tax=Hoeflea phototrophica (strain DSM 17068 / NCIMB 14078 / DFL-43) TaxID=411684 RepID=A9CV28_HOEPD|nr:hydantoinase/oxoprolinase family protein [Hoeflea phototrophica]EDQ35315.1 N-methylhydantoinase A/acetone carboxylase, beta subunit [Hoeflea phototrophica DFL-43]